MLSLRTSTGLALLLWGLCVLFEALSILLLVLIRSHPGVYTFDYWAENTVGMVVLATLGAVIAVRRPENRMGWLICAMALAGAVSHLGIEYAVYALLAKPGALPGGEAIAWVACWVFVPFFGLIASVVLLFPSGRLPSARWRPFAWVGGLVILVGTALAAVSPGTPGWLGPIENPLGIEALGELSGVVELVLIALILAAMTSLVARLRRARGDERQQLKWFVWAATPAAGGFILSSQMLVESVDAGWTSWATSLLLVAGIVSFAVALGIAILKYHLYDIDLVINRALVYGALTACVVGIYIALVGYLGALFEPQDNLVVSLLAAGVVAVLFAPLRERLQRRVNKLMYGERDDPYAVLQRLGERMEITPEPEAVLPNIAQTVAQALRLPHVAIWLKQNGELVEAARYGSEPVADPLVLPLVYRKEEVGQLVLSPRAGSEGFAKSEVGLLEALARQIGVAAHAVRLNEDLQRSREQLVVAREEERRRLRRDLHDGVGPRLAALTLKLETARNKLSRDPEAAALVGELSEQARQTIADVRRSVHALRPPSLDELGLLGALREGAAQYSQNGLEIMVEAPQELSLLPAAAEVACYRITSEAMTNVVRHAGANNCVVRIRLDEEAGVLAVEVEDDGRGIREDDEGGVGLRSMRERAEELGGRCTIEAPPAGGTRVVAELPCQLDKQTNAEARRGEGA